MTTPPPSSAVAETPTSAFTDREQRLLDEHQSDTCEVEMGACTAGCRPSCPPAYCTSERHTGKVAPVWPCNVVAPILGFRNADAYWQAEYEAMERYYSAAPQPASTAQEPEPDSEICHECKKKPRGPHRHWCSSAGSESDDAAQH